VSEASLGDRVVVGDHRAVARAISLIENEDPEGARLIGRIYPRTGRAYLVGVTGPPGAGKSTLVDRLITELRQARRTVGVLAVDPTSPFTGGAVLGDRVRMQAHAGDAGVFIRSMATRGHLGGLARTTAEAAVVLDAAGFDVILIETVGVGQDEVDIVRTADVSIVTTVPGSGDDVQTLKAGIMEIADIFVVNKADRAGADRMAASIEAMLSLEPWPEGTWRPPVLRTVATTGSGVPELLETIDRFREASGGRFQARRRTQAAWRLREIVGRVFLQHVERRVLAPGEFEAMLDRVAARELDPYAASDGILARALKIPAVASGDQGRAEPGVMSLDHVGIAVGEAGDMMRMADRLFDLATGAPEDVGIHRVRFIESAGATLELVEPLTPDAPVARFLATRGPGLHHVCFQVSDIDRMMTSLRARGVRFIDEAPRPGAHGSRIAFIHPSSTCGLLVELKEVRKDT
jgi:LAO/AO transport system kinase